MEQQILINIQHQISELKKLIQTISLTKPILDKWVPRSQVMAFLEYGPTQMAALEKSGNLTVTKVGKRKFILRESIATLLDKSIQLH